MTALPVTHEPASQRLHFRVSTPAEVCVKGLRYPTVDWSLGGFRIAAYSGDAHVRDRLQVEFALDFQGFESELAALPGEYAEPRGTILLAHSAAGEPWGVVGLAGGAAEPGAGRSRDGELERGAAR